MNQLHDKLSGGDRKSLGLAKEVALEVISQPASIEALLEGILRDNPIIRARSSVALKYIALLQPSLIVPYKKWLLQKMAPVDQWEVREQFCILFTKLDLSSREIERACEILNQNLTYYSSIVRTCAMQGLVDLTEMKPALKTTVEPLIREHTETGTAAMRARGRKLLKVLNDL